MSGFFGDTRQYRRKLPGRAWPRSACLAPNVDRCRLRRKVNRWQRFAWTVLLEVSDLGTTCWLSSRPVSARLPQLQTRLYIIVCPGLLGTEMAQGSPRVTVEDNSWSEPTPIRNSVVGPQLLQDERWVENAPGSHAAANALVDQGENSRLLVLSKVLWAVVECRGLEVYQRIPKVGVRMRSEGSRGYLGQYSSNRRRSESRRGSPMS